MNILIGFAVGYYVGSQAGKDAIEELKRAVNDIREAEDFAALQATALSMAGDFAKEVVSPQKSHRSELAMALAGEAATVLRRRLVAA